VLAYHEAYLNQIRQALPSAYTNTPEIQQHILDNLINGTEQAAIKRREINDKLADLDAKIKNATTTNPQAQ
jgi:hypothetical protein